MAIPVAAAGGGDDRSGDRRSEVRRLLLRLGQMKFGPPDPEIEHCILAISDLNRLEELFLRLLEARSWQELFQQAP